MRQTWLVLGVMGCGTAEKAVTEQSADSRSEVIYRGPGQWEPAAAPQARPVDITVVRSDLARGVVTQADANGDRVAFSLDEVVCTVDATSGTMQTDDEVATTTTGTTLADSSTDPSGTLRMLALANHRLYEVVTAGRSGADVVDLGGAVVGAQYVGNGFASLLDDGSVRWEGGEVVGLGATPLDTPLAVDGDLLMVATDLGVLAVDHEEAVVVLPVRADRIAVDPVSGTLVAAVGGSLRGHHDGVASWTSPLPSGATVNALTDGGALGLVLALVEDAGDRVVWVLDGATGEGLGTLELRDHTENIDVSARGGLLVQVRPNAATSWRITR